MKKMNSCPLRSRQTFQNRQQTFGDRKKVNFSFNGQQLDNTSSHHIWMEETEEWGDPEGEKEREKETLFVIVVQRRRDLQADTQVHDDQYQ